MSLSLVTRVRGKVRRSLARRGWMGTVLHVPRALFERLREMDPRRKRQRALLEKAQQEFDRDYHVQTAGQIDLAALEVVGDNRDLGHFYLGTHSQAFRTLLASLPIRHAEFVFIDLGSGKGKALLLAAEWPFKAVIGVEFAPALHQVALANFRTYSNPNQKCFNLCSRNTDVTAFEFPAEPSVLYFFNPFSEIVLRGVLENLHRSLAACPREVWACYAHPYAHGPLDASPDFELVSATTSCRIYRAHRITGPSSVRA
jgi:hypothetical protein